MEVKIKKSFIRRKTISARLIDDIMHIYVPHNIPDDKLNKVVEDFSKRFIKRKQKKELNANAGLCGIAERLNQEYFNGKIQIESIEYSSDQDRIFGSCSHHARTIRISHRLAEMPDWVRDYVIVHEMAHILEPNHGKAFWELVNRYKLTERARGFLMAKGYQED